MVTSFYRALSLFLSPCLAPSLSLYSRIISYFFAHSLSLSLSLSLVESWEFLNLYFPAVEEETRNNNNNTIQPLSSKYTIWSIIFYKYIFFSIPKQVLDYFVGAGVCAWETYSYFLDWFFLSNKLKYFSCFKATPQNW